MGRVGRKGETAGRRKENDWHNRFMGICIGKELEGSHERTRNCIFLSFYRFQSQYMSTILISYYYYSMCTRVYV